MVRRGRAAKAGFLAMLRHKLARAGGRAGDWALVIAA